MMMKKISYGLSFLMIAVFVSASMAQPQPATTSAPTERLAMFRSVIEKIDDAAKTIEVRGKVAGPLTFFTNENTKIIVGNKEASFADLKIGLFVVVEYKQEGTKFIAVTITEGAPASRRRPSAPSQR